MIKRFFGMLAIAGLVALPIPAMAQTATTYQLTDSANAVHQAKGFTCPSSLLCLAHVPIDSSGALFGVTGNPFFVSPAAGATFPVSGTFWQTTQPVSIATMPSTPVTGTFWPYALGQQLAAGSVPIVLTALQLAALTPPAAITGFALAANQSPPLAPVVSTTAEANHILKGSPGNLFALTVTIGAVSGWVMVYDATTPPADGAVTPKFCRYVKSDGTGGALSVAFTSPLIFATGITAGFSSTGCFTKTASSTAFIAGQVQ